MEWVHKFRDLITKTERNWPTFFPPIVFSFLYQLFRYHIWKDLRSFQKIVHSSAVLLFLFVYRYFLTSFSSLKSTFDSLLFISEEKPQNQKRFKFRERQRIRPLFLLSGCTWTPKMADDLDPKVRMGISFLLDFNPSQRWIILFKAWIK
jgi:hypothetical protein